VTEYKGIECKIYPNKAQTEIIHQTFGSTRFIWNQLLSMLNERYENNKELKMLSFNTLAIILPQIKREYQWLKDADAVALQQTVKMLSETFTRFFKGYCKYPKFKSKKDYKKSYRTIQKNIRFNESRRYIKLPKLGWVKVHPSVNHIENERIKSVVVKQLPDGKYYISLLVESERQALPLTNKNVGIDLGLTELVITSDGQKFKSQRLHLKYKKQLHYWEKRLARRRIQAIKNGIPLIKAKNYQVARKQVARLHNKIANTRKNYLHNITTELVKKYDVIVIEDLKVSNMIKNHNLARSITNQSWRQFRTILEYKCEIYGKKLVVVNPYKTSQLCSFCSQDTGKKALSIRRFECPNCHTKHDRDINASINILNIGLKHLEEISKVS
jgi:putative transposase